MCRYLLSLVIAAMAHPARVRVVDPLFLKKSQVDGMTDGDNINYTISNAMRSVVGDAAVCAQLINGLWYLYTKTDAARLKLLDSGLYIEGTNLQLFDENPWSINGVNFLSEKVIVRDVPFTMTNEKLTVHLHNTYPQLILTSNINYSKIWDNNESMTDMYNGDRYFYVQGGFTPILPRTGYIGDTKIRLWHRSQKNMCQRCLRPGHLMTETNKCGSYINPKSEAQKKLMIFQTAANPLSNYWEDDLCEGFPMNNIHCKTSEHAYHYLKCLEYGYTEVAERILTAPSPGAAKGYAANALTVEQNRDWADKKEAAMLRVLSAKAHGRQEFRQKLLEAEHSTIVEAGKDAFWSCGLQHSVAASTKLDFMPGENHLGMCLMQTRDSILQTIGMADGNTSTEATDKSQSDTQTEGEGEEGGEGEGGDDGRDTAMESEDAEQDTTLVEVTASGDVHNSPTPLATGSTSQNPDSTESITPESTPKSTPQAHTSKDKLYSGAVNDERRVRQGRSRLQGTNGSRSRSSSLKEIQARFASNSASRVQTLDNMWVNKTKRVKTNSGDNNKNTKEKKGSSVPP